MCACSKPRSGFPMPYGVVLFVFDAVSLEVIVRFVDN